MSVNEIISIIPMVLFGISMPLFIMGAIKGKMAYAHLANAVNAIWQLSLILLVEATLLRVICFSIHTAVIALTIVIESRRKNRKKECKIY